MRKHLADLTHILNSNGHPHAGHEIAEMAVKLGYWSDSRQRPPEFLSSLRGEPVRDTNRFSFVKGLEARFPEIRAELDAVEDRRKRGFVPVREPIYQGKWDQILLYSNGHREEKACRSFPVLAAAIEGITEATTMAGCCISLSWLHPDTHITPHCGPTNTRLRLHMGLKVPPGCSIRVADRKLVWEEGKCFIFDDSYEHEVWHQGTSERIVLLMDLWHPDLTADQREILSRQVEESERKRMGRYLTSRQIARIDRLEDRQLIFAPTPKGQIYLERLLANEGARAASLDEMGKMKVEK